MFRSGMRSVGLCVTALALIAVGCGNDDKKESADTGSTTTAATEASTTTTTAKGLDAATIGVILPTTGALAIPATEIQHGMQTAVDLWNEVYKTPVLTLEVCDDGGVPERSLTCIDKFASEKVAVFSGPHFGTTWLAAQQSYADRDAFVVTGTPAAVPDPGSTIFTSGTPVDVALHASFKELAGSGVKSLGFLSTADGTAQAAAADADKVAADNGLTIQKAEFAPDASTALPQAQQLVSSSPDAIMIWSSGLTAITALRGLKEAGYQGRVVMNYSNAGANTYALAKDAVPEDLSMIGTTAMIGEVTDTTRQDLITKFRAAYEPKYGVASFNALSAGDIVMVAGVAAAHGSTPEEMTNYLESGADVPGFAVPFKFSAKSHVGSNDPDVLRLVKLVNGAWEAADK